MAMKSYDKKISISVRKYPSGKSVIQIRRLPIKIYGDKIISTGDEPTEQNIQKYKIGGLDEWKKITNPQSPETFRKFAVDVLIIINANVSKTTKLDRENRLEKYIYPTFGDVALDDITSKDIEIWQSKLKVQKGADYAIRCKYLFKRILNKAVAEGKLKSNPIEATEIIKSNKKSIREIYTKDEIRAMLSASTGWLRLFILIRAYCGLRSAEMVGLKWSDFDFNQKTILVCRSIRWGRILPPKGQNRVVHIPTIVYEALLEHKEQSTSDWVFVSERYNTYWSDCSVINRNYFQPLLEKLNIKYKSFYSLRHSFATYSLINKRSSVSLQYELGHKKHSTLDFYIKYVEEIRGAENIDDFLDF